jgi:hypothetical protein
LAIPVSFSVEAIKRYWENIMEYPAGITNIEEIISAIMAKG